MSSSDCSFPPFLCCIAFCIALPFVLHCLFVLHRSSPNPHTHLPDYRKVICLSISTLQPVFFQKLQPISRYRKCFLCEFESSCLTFFKCFQTFFVYFLAVSGLAFSNILTGYSPCGLHKICISMADRQCQRHAVMNGEILSWSIFKMLSLASTNP